MTLIMGIINLTPDSFSDGGCFNEVNNAIKQARALKEAGADILDLGAESTRLGATFVDEETEKSRLLPILKALADEGLGPFSVDTYKASVAQIAVENGATFINDVKGIHVDKEMANVARNSNAKWILMDDQPFTAISQSIKKMEEAVNTAIGYGVNRNNLLIDPGLGFSKNTNDNLILTTAIPAYKRLGLPLLYGPSRKRFIGEITGQPVNNRDSGTAAICAIAVYLGADIVRVHDVNAVRDAVLIGKSLQDIKKIVK